MERVRWIKMLWVVAAGAGLVAGLAGCPTLLSPVVGRWQMESSGEVLNFSPFGSYTVEGTDESATWQWDPLASVLTIEFPGEGTQAFDARFEGNQMILSTGGQEVVRFTRV